MRAYFILFIRDVAFCCLIRVYLFILKPLHTYAFISFSVSCVLGCFSKRLKLGKSVWFCAKSFECYRWFIVLFVEVCSYNMAFLLGHKVNIYIYIYICVDDR